MRLGAALILGAVAWLAAPPVVAAPGTEDTPSVRFRNYGCMGPCPVYEIVVFGDGRVRYRGQHFVHSGGERWSSRSQAVARRLMRRVSRFKPKEGRLCHTDDIVTVTELHRGGEVQTHKNNDGWCPSPKALATRALDRRIRRVARVRRWVRASRRCERASRERTIQIHIDTTRLDRERMREVERMFFDAFIDDLRVQPSLRLQLWVAAPASERAAAQRALDVVVEGLDAHGIDRARVAWTRVDEGDASGGAPVSAIIGVVVRAVPEACIAPRD